MICTNTTIDKSHLSDQFKSLQVGLSGKPLFRKSNDVLTKVSNALGRERTIIGVGGIDSYESASEKFRLGANLLQLYTGLVYKGPKVIEDILQY